jgi:group I intron endonuclease
MGYIYSITNIINGYKYIGQSVAIDIETRWNQHRYKRQEGRIYTYLQKAIHKYGIENFKFSIICITFDSSCNSMEEYYISKYNTLAPNGYNLKIGGNSSRHHPDTIKKISESLKGRITNPKSIGKKLTEEHKEKLRKSFTDERRKQISELNKKRTGLPMTEERKQVLSNHHKGKTVSDETKQRMSDAHKARWLKRRTKGLDIQTE